MSLPLSLIYLLSVQSSDCATASSPLLFSLVLLAYGLLMADPSHVHVSLHRSLSYPMGVLVSFIVTPFDVPNIYVQSPVSDGHPRCEPMRGLDWPSTIIYIIYPQRLLCSLWGP